MIWLRLYGCFGLLFRPSPTFSGETTVLANSVGIVLPCLEMNVFHVFWDKVLGNSVGLVLPW